MRSVNRTIPAPRWAEGLSQLTALTRLRLRAWQDSPDITECPAAVPVAPVMSASWWKDNEHLLQHG
jgi:hypothetical protein